MSIAVGMSSLPTLNIATNISPDSTRSRTASVAYDDRSSSPEAPPYSPITPVLPSIATRNENAGSQRAQPPPFLPFAESENSDAIALRSAISILQIQRQQSLRDLRMLEQQKSMAMADPEAFVAEVAAGRVKTSSTLDLLVGATAEESPSDNHEDPEATSDNDDGRQPLRSNHKFDIIPGPQNVIRAPPINWSKYHIIGEPLDRLHDEQRVRPLQGPPRKDDDKREPEHVIAAPYSPWKDALMDQAGQVQDTSKKHS